MTKTLLIATVAALAISAPAQAERADRRADSEERAQKAKARAEARQAAGGGERRARAERPQRIERTQRQERVRMERPQRQERVRMERPQRERLALTERPQREQRIRVERAERPQREQRVRIARALREERVRSERPQREQRVRIARALREERVGSERHQRERLVRAERPQREQRLRTERVANRQNRIERRALVERQQSRRSERLQSRHNERMAAQQLRQQQRRSERLASFGNRGERRLERQQQRQSERLANLGNRGERRFDRQQLRQSERLARLSNLGERRLERQQLRQVYRLNRDQQRAERRLAAIGTRLNRTRARRDWYDDYAARRHQTYFGARSNERSYDRSPDYSYDYDYDDGYLYQVRRDNDLVTALYPLLGGAFSSGRVLPTGYQDYNVPYAYRSLYYDTPDYAYRYGDGAIYRVDPSTQLISAVVALLSGQSLGVGQMLPTGYDVYNVPYAYRDTYYDRQDAWYRYDDGNIYQVDPYSRLITGMYPVSHGGYAVGYPVPAYANYGGYGDYAGYPSYSAPYGYQNLYYGAPGYNYHYANGGIYQVDPTTQLISALVALVTGTNLGVGQMLPTGYDAYNVPDAYRSTYFDTDDAWYRYDDGYIYEVDPYSRMIETAIPVAYGGYAVGQPIPAAYPGYAVPATYSGLYEPVDGYDYRYFDGGIYQVQPDTRVVVAPVALVTGNTWSVGQPLPTGYDAYNVPYAYRDRYFDNDENMYRYADGHIYQVDPQTRLIRAVIDAIV